MLREPRRSAGPASAHNFATLRFTSVVDGYAT
jgi:hypothetical protein